MPASSSSSASPIKNCSSPEFPSKPLDVGLICMQSACPVFYCLSKPSFPGRCAICSGLFNICMNRSTSLKSFLFSDFLEIF